MLNHENIEKIEKEEADASVLLVYTDTSLEMWQNMLQDWLIILAVPLSLCALVLGHENPHQFANVVNHPPAPAHAHSQPPSPNLPPSQQRQDNRLRNKEHTHNQEHIREHLDGKVKMAQDQMSEEELQFHYFKLHDYDNNNKLDGIELTSAVTHFHSEDGEKNQVHALSDQEIAPIIDNILRDEDINMDGYIDYSEFMMSQRQAPPPS